MIKKLSFLIIAMVLLCSCTNSKSTSDISEDQMSSTSLSNNALNDFNDKAIEDMLRVKSVGIDEYFTQYQSEDAYTAINSFDSLEFDEPYQAAIADPDRYTDSINKLIDIYLLSKMDQASQQTYNCSNFSYYSSTEVLGSTLLAGDRNEYVMAVAFRYALNGNESDVFKKQVEEFGTFYEIDNINYLYGTVAIHAIMVKDYIYEMSGIADCNEVVSEFADKYPDNMELYNSVLYAAHLPEKEEWASTSTESLQVTYNNGQSFTDVPISSQLLFARGDQQSGAMTSLANESYYVSSDLTVFAYGGSTEVPLSVIVSTDSGKTWSKHEISSEYKDVRQIWVSNPDNKNLYVVITTGRTMSQEGSVVFFSTDHGVTWSQVDSQSDLLNIHFLTIDASFTDSNTGFICIEDTEKPNMFVTHDGGITWDRADLSGVPEGYSAAWAPFSSDGTLVMYISESGSTDESGPVYEMISNDNGLSWTLGQHLVIK